MADQSLLGFLRCSVGTLLGSYLCAILIALGVSIKSSVAHAKVTCPEIYSTLFAHSELAMKSLEKGTGFFYWGRARVALEATPSDVLEQTFKKMSKKDLEELFWAVKSGTAKATREEEKMLDELWHMVDDLGDHTFWGPTTNRSVAIRDALRLHDAKLGFSGDPAFAAQLQDAALGKTDVEILARALGEHQKNAKYANSKFFDRLVRFFSPHYDKVNAVIATNNSIRRRLQKMYVIDKPALEAIPKYRQTLGLTDEEVKELQNQLSDTAAQLSDARKDIENLYGREVSSDKPLPEAEIRIRDLAKKAVSLGSAEKEKDLTAISEADMDTIDRVIGRAWNRSKETMAGMPVSEKHDVHLQVRNPQYRRETPQKRAAYLNVTEIRSPSRSNYQVETTWTVTVKHEEPKTRLVPKTTTTVNSKGETEQKTEMVLENYIDEYTTTYEMSRKDILNARYEEALKNGVRPSDHINDLPSLPPAERRGAWAVDADNGPPSVKLTTVGEQQVQSILADASSARATEKPYRDLIAAATSQVDSITNESYQAALKVPGGAKKILGELEAQEQALKASRAKLDGYLGSDPAAVQAQWRHDKPGDFKDRNQMMIQRFDHMITRVAHLAEQVRRESPSLVIEYTLPTYEPQLQQLRAIKEKNQKIIRTTVGTTAAAGAATAGFVYREEIMETVRGLMGNEDERKR